MHDSATIGRQCHLCQGVTVGRGHGSGGYGAPTVGDGVYVGPNAVVLGKITVGDGAHIAANTVVTIDVPPDGHIGPPVVAVDRPVS